MADTGHATEMILTNGRTAPDMRENHGTNGADRWRPERSGLDRYRQLETATVLLADTTVALQSTVQTLAALLASLRDLLSSLQTSPGHPAPAVNGEIGHLTPAVDGEVRRLDWRRPPRYRVSSGEPPDAPGIPVGIRQDAGAGPSDGPKLTARQREVLMLLSRGMSNRQIARALGISEKTVKNHMHAIFSRLALSHRTQAALYASRGAAAG